MSRFLVVAAAAVGAILIPAGVAQAAAANHRPTVPATLSAAGIACGDKGIFIGTTTPELGARLDDPDFGVNAAESVTATFALWPVGHAEQRVEWSAGTPLTVAGGLARSKPAAPLLNGVRYRFEVRATDAAGAQSRWSPECTFTVDTTVPHPPAVTSTDYPATGEAGGPGIPGTFTLAVAGGDTDVVKFRWSAPGVGLTDVPVGAHGRAVIRYTPATYATNHIAVQAIDRTGNRSGETTYEFRVRDTEPQLTDLTPDAGPGESHTLRVAPGKLGGLVSYDYRLNDGPATTVTAAADGTATFVVTPTAPGMNTVSVIGHTAAGLPTGEARWSVNLVYPPTTPTVTSPDFPADGTPPPLVGQQVTLTFHPGEPGVTEYVWSTDFGATERVTPAGPDGTATVQYTPRDWPYLDVQIRSRAASGTESSIAEFGWDLTSHAPQVSSEQYPMYGSGTGAGEFVFAPAHDGVTGYEYSFNDGETQTVTGETATITWTPDASGWVTLRVREHVGDIVSDPTEYQFRVL
ncbi:hypothetical protein ODJ79_26230 [Actinoplanes sp. KI2]|uniref:hypothetical protein n=1 Tax=Actinoplanes sp. KI2 TaxID=2983315 RepID=UPI0021D5A60F|nr:hypothetical protein [Actinoplanes sp. KI2]MCU7727242.1 hypothetical protein [Actinoplanes sp. KI2]